MEPESPKKYTLTFSALQLVSFGLSAVLLIAGGLGMVVSFLYLASRSMEDITAGASGFVASAVLIGLAAISLALACRSTESH